jgi:hypothetical protein
VQSLISSGPFDFVVGMDMTESMTNNELLTFAPFAEPPPAVTERISKQPECALLWAVLENGLATYMRYATATNRRGKRLFQEAETWIMEDDATWLCSFMNICYVLGLDPEYLRMGLRRWRASHAPQAFQEAA